MEFSFCVLLQMMDEIHIVIVNSEAFELLI